MKAAQIARVERLVINLRALLARYVAGDVEGFKVLSDVTMHSGQSKWPGWAGCHMSSTVILCMAAVQSALLPRMTCSEGR